MRTILQSKVFTCPFCDLECKAIKYEETHLTEEPTNNVFYTVEVEHETPCCKLYKSMGVADFLRAGQAKIQKTNPGIG